MSDRYTKLSKLPDNLYLDGAPVLIAAGALLKDNINGGVILQLKLCNLSHHMLTACKVSVRAFDPSGAELEGVDGFSYLDLFVGQGDNFGAKVPIPLPDSTTRRVSVCVMQAVFEAAESGKQDVWQHPVCEWEPLLEQQMIEEKFSDYELRRQYFIETDGTDGECRFVPQKVGSVFLCDCGTVNLVSEKVCYECGGEFETLVYALDEDMLTEKMNERLAEEEAERIEREQKAEQEEKERRRKMKITAAIVLSAAAAFIIFVVILK